MQLLKFKFAWLHFLNKLQMQCLLQEENSGYSARTAHNRGPPRILYRARRQDIFQRHPFLSKIPYTFEDVLDMYLTLR